MRESLEALSREAAVAPRAALRDRAQVTEAAGAASLRMTVQTHVMTGVTGFGSDENRGLEHPAVELHTQLVQAVLVALLAVPLVQDRPSQALKEVP